MVEAGLSELIDDEGGGLHARLLDQMIQQRRLAAAQESVIRLTGSRFGWVPLAMDRETVNLLISGV